MPSTYKTLATIEISIKSKAEKSNRAYLIALLDFPEYGEESYDDVSILKLFGTVICFYC